MTRRYDEPIDVTVSVDPQAFLWRGRIFRVREVLDRWQERRVWWRESDSPDERGLGAARGERERQVWRVEASAGRLARVGVYDLGADDAGPDGRATWLLLRALD